MPQIDMNRSLLQKLSYICLSGFGEMREPRFDGGLIHGLTGCSWFMRQLPGTE